jgi:AcrR family transcriptional regulator
METQPPRLTSRRARPAKAALSRDVIVETALQLLHDEGYEAMSMRRVAQALDTGPASLYVYVANREALLDLMLDRAIATVPLPAAPDPARWREQLKELLTAMAAMMTRDYPGITRHSMATVPTGPAALTASEAMVSLLRAGGMADQSVGYACDVLSLYVQAHALETSLFRERTGSQPGAEQQYYMGVAERFKSLSPDEYPNLSALAPQLMAGDGDQRFEAGLDVIINGLLATPLEDRLQRWF